MMKVFFAISFFVILFNGLAFSQVGIYEPLGAGATGGMAPSSIVYDSVENKLFVGGGFYQLGGKAIKGLAEWNGYTWDSIPEIPYFQATNLKKVNGKIYAYGRELWVKDDFGIWSFIAKADTAEGITNLEWFNNELIIMGAFDSLNNIPFNSFARYDGISLLPFTIEVWPLYSCFFYTSAVFDGELYIGGTFSNSSGTLRDLMKYDGVSNWVQVGPPLNGIGAGYGELMVYKSYLYLGGYFKQSAGNIGNHFLRYDGVTFDNLSGGFDPLIGFSDMEIKDSLLFISGPKALNTGLEFGGFITFNGTNFCTYDTLSFTTGLAVNFSHICFMGDTLAVIGNYQAYNGDTINRLGKYLGGFVSVNCVNVGLEESTLTDISFLVFPNPNDGNFTIKSNSKFNNTQIKILNSLGEIILQKETNFENKIQINISNQPKGIYFVLVQTNKGISTAKIVLE